MIESYVFRAWWLAPLCLVLAAAGRSQTDSPGCQIYTAGIQCPQSIDLGDFDGDGVLDLAVLSSNTAEISVLLGDGHGGFAPGVVVADLNGQPRARGGPIVSADFDEDGALDLAVGDPSSQNCFLLFGGGDGSFRRSLPIQLGANPVAMTVVELNGDGHPDLLVATATEMHVFHGTATRLLRYASTWSVPETPHQMTTGDVNGDGHLDVAFCFRSRSRVFFFLGSPGGRYSPGIGPQVTGGVVDVLAGHFNEDSALDLAVADSSGTLSLFFGDGSLRFPSRQDFSVPDGEKSLAVADFNCDSLVDLAVASSEAETVCILLGNGDGTYRSLPPRPVAPTPSTIVAGDLDGDCRFDIAIGAPVGELVGRCLNPCPSDVLQGTVNRRGGPPVDVLFLNDSSGAGAGRRVLYGVLAPFELRIDRPPTVPISDLAPFAVYVWSGLPRPEGLKSLPFRIGCTAMPMPITGGDPQPDVVWNNARRFRHLGVPTHSSSPAPSILFRRPQGIRRAVTFFVQGLIFDPGSAGSVRASVTNGIIAVPRF